MAETQDWRRDGHDLPPGKRARFIGPAAAVPPDNNNDNNNNRPLAAVVDLSHVPSTLMPFLRRNPKTEAPRNDPPATEAIDSHPAIRNAPPAELARFKKCKNLKCSTPSRVMRCLSVGCKDAGGKTTGTTAVNCVRWSKPLGQYLASASMDWHVRVWNPCFDDRDPPCEAPIPLLDLDNHNGAVKDVQFSNDSSILASGGFDGFVRITDFRTGRQTHALDNRERVTSLAFNPKENALILAGLARSGIVCWDTRTSSVVRRFRVPMGETLDLAFLSHCREFVSTTDVTARNVDDKLVTVWDFGTGAQTSGQIVSESYTCPCVRVHPNGSQFVAQTNGNYIGCFSSTPPYRLSKPRRFGNAHQVRGFHIQCSFSPDGGILATGSADGKAIFYDWNSMRVIRTLPVHDSVCMDVEFHPILPSVIATCSWDGGICLFE